MTWRESCKMKEKKKNIINFNQISDFDLHYRMINEKNSNVTKWLSQSNWVMHRIEFGCWFIFIFILRSAWWMETSMSLVNAISCAVIPIMLIVSNGEVLSVVFRWLASDIIWLLCCCEEHGVLCSGDFLPVAFASMPNTGCSPAARQTRTHVEHLNWMNYANDRKGMSQMSVHVNEGILSVFNFFYLLF